MNMHLETTGGAQSSVHTTTNISPWYDWICQWKSASLSVKMVKNSRSRTLESSRGGGRAFSFITVGRIRNANEGNQMKRVKQTIFSLFFASFPRLLDLLTHYRRIAKTTKMPMFHRYYWAVVSETQLNAADIIWCAVFAFFRVILFTFFVCLSCRVVFLLEYLTFWIRILAHTYFAEMKTKWKVAKCVRHKKTAHTQPKTCKKSYEIYAGTDAIKYFRPFSVETLRWFNADRFCCILVPPFLAVLAIFCREKGIKSLPLRYLFVCKIRWFAIFSLHYFRKHRLLSQNSNNCIEHFAHRQTSRLDKSCCYFSPEIHLFCTLKIVAICNRRCVTFIALAANTFALR